MIMPTYFYTIPSLDHILNYFVLTTKLEFVYYIL